MVALGSRLVVAGTSSGAGKTTVATGLMAALAQRGMRVASAKVGPDFIDPGYHALATDRPARNLDAWMCGTAAIGPLAGRAAQGVDILVVEGVMGLFDGSSDPSGPTASTAQVAQLLGAPVVLVVDGSSVGASVAAVVHGFANFDPAVKVAGVILNRVGSDSHEELLRQAVALTGIPVLGALRRDPALAWRSRHLGLVPVVEHAGDVRRSLSALAAAVTDGCDLAALVALAASAPAMEVDEPARAEHRFGVRLGVAGGSAFGFYYPDNLEALAQAGAEIVAFDPLGDPRLPEAIDGVYVGGGFPECFAEALAANHSLLGDLRRRSAEGLVVWAECGGLLWLAECLDDHRLAGVVAARAAMGDRVTLGYRRARLRVGTPLGPVGTELRGHEFHYSRLQPGGDAYEWRGRTGGGRAGFASPSLFASYLHLHLGADPAPAEHLVSAMARRGDSRNLRLW